MKHWWSTVKRRGFSVVPPTLAAPTPSSTPFTNNPDAESESGSDDWELEGSPGGAEERYQVPGVQSRRASMASLRVSLQGAFNRSTQSLSSLLDRNTEDRPSRAATSDSEGLLEVLSDPPASHESLLPSQWAVSTVRSAPPVLEIAIPPPSLGIRLAEPDLESESDATRLVPSSPQQRVDAPTAPLTPFSEKSPGVPVYQVIGRPKRPTTATLNDMAAVSGGRDNDLDAPARHEAPSTPTSRSARPQPLFGPVLGSPDSTFTTPSSTTSGLIAMNLNDDSPFEYERFSNDSTPRLHPDHGSPPQSPATPTPSLRTRPSYRVESNGLGRSWPSGTFQRVLPTIADLSLVDSDVE